MSDRTELVLFLLEYFSRPVFLPIGSDVLSTFGSCSALSTCMLLQRFSVRACDIFLGIASYYASIKKLSIMKQCVDIFSCLIKMKKKSNQQLAAHAIFSLCIGGKRQVRLLTDQPLSSRQTHVYICQFMNSHYSSMGEI